MSVQLEEKFEYNEANDNLIYVSLSSKPILFTTSSLQILAVHKSKKGDLLDFTVKLNEKEIEYFRSLEKTVITDLKQNLLERGVKRLKSTIRRLGEVRGLRVTPVYKKSFKTTLLDENRKLVPNSEWDTIIKKNLKVHIVFQPYAVWTVKEMTGIYLRPIQIVASASKS